MYQKVLLFIRYNNAFAIAVVLLFSGFGVTYAASPEVRESIYSSTETVVSVDNQQILSTELDNFNFNLRINSVTEDDKNYYAAYSYQMLTIEDSVWQTTTIEKTLTVNKEALDGKDFGLYATKELAENINYELSYLKRVQKIEREKGESQKVVTTEYSGLIGKLLNPKEEVIEGYTPVIPEPVPEASVPQVASPESAVIPVVNSEPPAPPAPVSESTPAPVASPQPEPTPETPETPETTSTAPSTVATSTPISEPAPEPIATTTPVSGPILEPIVITTPASEPATSTPETIPHPSPEASAGTAEPIP